MYSIYTFAYLLPTSTKLDNKIDNAHLRHFIYIEDQIMKLKLFQLKNHYLDWTKYNVKRCLPSSLGPDFILFFEISILMEVATWLKSFYK